MIKTITIVVPGLVVLAQALQGQDRSRYRDFYLGENVLSASALTKAAATDDKTIHQRPALMQERAVAAAVRFEEVNGAVGSSSSYRLELL